MGESTTELGKKIILLRDQGFSYRQISVAIPCSKATVAYYLTKGASETKKGLVRAYKATPKGVLSKKINLFRSRCYNPIPKPKASKKEKTHRECLRGKMKQFRRRSKQSSYSRVNNITTEYGIEEVLDKVGENPRCYLTGSQIDIGKSETYSFDHVTPISKGGTNDIKNMGLVTHSANMAKNDLTVSQFIALCKKVLMHNGYYVKKIDKEQKKKKV